MIDVPPRLVAREVCERGPHGDALIQLRQLRRANEFLQLRLSDEDDLNQLLVVGLEIRQHTDLLQEFNREMLCLVENRDACAAIRKLLQKVRVQLVEQFLPRGRVGIAQSKLGQQRLQHLDTVEKRVEDQRDP